MDFLVFEKDAIYAPWHVAHFLNGNTLFVSNESSVFDPGKMLGIEVKQLQTIVPEKFYQPIFGSNIDKSSRPDLAFVNIIGALLHALSERAVDTGVLFVSDTEFAPLSFLFQNGRFHGISDKSSSSIKVIYSHQQKYVFDPQPDLKNVYSVVFAGLNLEKMGMLKDFSEKQNLKNAIFVATSQAALQRLVQLGLNGHYIQNFPGVGKKGEIKCYELARSIICKIDEYFSNDRSHLAQLWRLFANDIDSIFSLQLLHEAIVETGTNQAGGPVVLVIGQKNDFWQYSNIGSQITQFEKPINYFYTYSKSVGFELFAKKFDKVSNLFLGAPELLNTQSCLQKEFDDQIANNLYSNKGKISTPPVMLFANFGGRRGPFIALKQIVEKLNKLNVSFLLVTKNRDLASWFNEKGWPNLFIGSEFTSSIKIDFSLKVGSFLSSFFGFLQNSERNRTLSKTEMAKVARLFAGTSNSEFFCRELANSLQHFHIYNSLIRMVKPQSVFILPYSSGTSRSMEQAAISEDVPVFTLTVAGLPPHARGVSWVDPNVNYLVPGSQARDSLVAMGHSEEKIIQTGNPIYDPILNSRTTISHEIVKKLKLHNGKKVILVATSGVIHNEYDWINHLALVCEKRGDWHLIVKPHGSVAKETVHSNLPACGNSMSIVEDFDGVALLSCADVLITDWSTIGFEAALLDKPILIVNLTDVPFPYRYEEDEIALLVNRKEDIEDRINLLLTDETLQKSFEEKRKVQIQRANYLNDGNAANRIARILSGK